MIHPDFIFTLLTNEKKKSSHTQLRSLCCHFSVGWFVCKQDYPKTVKLLGRSQWKMGLGEKNINVSADPVKGTDQF